MNFIQKNFLTLFIFFGTFSPVFATQQDTDEQQLECDEETKQQLIENIASSGIQKALQDKAKTKGGKEKVEQMLQKPICNTKKLEERKECIKCLQNKTKDLKQALDGIDTIVQEKNINAFLEADRANSERLANAWRNPKSWEIIASDVSFGWLRGTLFVTPLLFAKATYDCYTDLLNTQKQTPSVSTMFSALGQRAKKAVSLRLPNTASEAIISTPVLGMYCLYPWIQGAQRMRAYTVLCQIRQLLEQLHTIKTTLENGEKNVFELTQMKQLTEGDYSLKATFDQLSKWNAGSIKYYQALTNNQHCLAQALEELYTVDAYYAVATFMETTPEAHPVCYAKFTEQNLCSPHIDLAQFHMPQKDSVTNDIQLGTELDAKDAMFAAPNATGKSYTMKAILLNSIILPQTFGIACAKSATINPFESLELYLKNDSKRTEEPKTEQRSNNKKCLFMADEPFSGPRDEIVSKRIKSLCTTVSEDKNTIALIASHANAAQEAEKQTKTMRCYHFGAEKTNNPKKIFRLTRKITKGPDPFWFSQNHEKCIKYITYITNNAQAPASPVDQTGKNECQQKKESPSLKDHAKEKINNLELGMQVTIPDKNRYFDQSGIMHNELIKQILTNTKTQIGEDYLNNLIFNPTYNDKTIKERQEDIKSLEQANFSRGEIQSLLETTQKNLNLVSQEKKLKEAEITSKENWKKIAKHSVTLLQAFCSLLTDINLYKKLLAKNGANERLSTQTIRIAGHVAWALYKTVIPTISPGEMLRECRQMGHASEQAAPKSKNLRLCAKNAGYVSYFIQQGGKTYLLYEVNSIIAQNLEHKRQHLHYVKNILKAIQEIRDKIPQRRKEKLTGDIQQCCNTHTKKALESELFDIEKQNAAWSLLPHNAWRIQQAYQHYKKDREMIAQALVEIGYIDGITAVASHMKKQETHIKFADFSDQKTPYLDVQNFCLPGTTKHVKNSLNCNASGQCKDAIITGASESGKTTTLKSLFYNGFLLPQTLGITWSQEATIAPFTRVELCGNEPDKQGTSHFQAQKERCNKISKNLSTSDRCLVLAENPLSGTKETITQQELETFYGALSQSKQCIAIIETQLPPTNAQAKNIKHLTVNETAQNGFERTFQLTQGSDPLWQDAKRASEYLTWLRK